MADDLSDLLRHTRDLAASVAVMAAVLEARQETAAADREALRRIEERCDALAKELGRIVCPVSEHYDALRVAREADEANRGRWANTITVDRAVAAVKWIAGIVTLLGVGGGMGAQFRGCSGALVTAADMQQTQDEGTSSP